MDKVTLLDCTIRDGGFTTNFVFPDGFVTDLVTLDGVGYVEVGYVHKDVTKGSWFNVDLETFEINATVSLAVMGDFGKFDPNEIPKSPIITLFRIVCQVEDFCDALGASRILQKKGYKTSINLCHCSYIKDDDLVQITDAISVSPPDWLYIADSFGSIRPDRVAEIVEVLSRTGVPIGFHGHNNTGLAMVNTMTAIRFGARMVDCTVGGIGKGGGNLCREYLLHALNQPIDHIIHFVDSYRDVFPSYSRYTITGFGNAHCRYAGRHHRSLLQMKNEIERLSDEKSRDCPRGNRICCVIPARLNSSRLPQKLIRTLPQGLSVIQSTCRQVLKCRSHFDLYVATDSTIIAEMCKGICPVIRVNADCKNGTERVYHCLDQIPEYEVYLNVQADQPYINPDHIDLLLDKHRGYCSTLHTHASTLDNSITKVVLGVGNRILYISRNVIPGVKEGKATPPSYQTLGVYAYSREALIDMYHLPIGPYQECEDIELLKLVENNKTVYSFEVSGDVFDLNTEEDWKNILL